MKTLLQLGTLLILTFLPSPQAHGVEKAPITMSELTGQYYFGDGLGVNCRLQLQAVGTFSYTWVGCLGLYDRNDGKAVIQDGMLRLMPSTPNPNERGGVRGTPTRFLPIRWGRRMYLIPPEEMIRFCNAVNRGRESRTAPGHLFYVRQDSGRKAVKGVPEVPATYQKFLLRKPVQGKITQRIGKDDAWVDLGSKDGVFRGQELTAWDRRGRGRLTSVEVNRVETDRCRIKTTFGDELAIGESVWSHDPF